jgi:hypothetical protein
MTQAVISAEKQVEPADPATISSLRLGDNEAARALLRQWMEDESGYDEKVWPLVKEMIEENRLSERKRFAE